MSVIERAVAYWKASEYSGSGNWLDLSGNAHHLTPAGGANAPTFLPSPAAGRKYVYHPGIAGNYVTTPDTATLDITSDIELRAAVVLPDYTPAANVSLIAKAANGNLAYRLVVIGTTGRIALFASTDGLAFNAGAQSSAAPVITDNTLLLVRAVLDVNNGSGGHDNLYYTKTSTEATAAADLASDSGWTQLGTTVTTAGTVSIANTSAALNLGRKEDGDNEYMTGRFLAAEVRNGIAGTVAFRFDATDAAQPYATMVDDTGKTVTFTRSSAGKKLAVVDRATWLFGTDDKMTAADHANLDFASADSFTLAVACRRYGTPAAFQIILSKREAASPFQGYLIGFATSAPFSVGLDIDDGPTYLGSTDAAGVEGILHAVTGRRSVSLDQIQTFLDGVGATAVADTTVNTLVNADTLYVGTQNSAAGDLYYDGEIVGLSIFREALSTTDIATLSAELLYINPTPYKLTSGTDNTQQTSYATASVTPTANRLQLLSVVSTKATGPATTPTVTGCNLTWVAIRSVPHGPSDTQRLTVFRALGASPTTGAITIAFGGVEQTGATWALTEFSNVNTSGTNGSGAIVQHHGGTSAASAVSGLTVQINQISNARNVHFQAYSYIDNGAVTPGTDFTELHEVQDTLPDRTLQTQYQIGRDRTGEVTSAMSVSDEGIAGIGLEIRVVGQGTQVTKLTNGSDSTDTSSFTTASITPSANALILASVYNSKASAADLPTITGCGLTWVQVATSTHGTSASERLTLFRAMGTAPTPGTLTIDFAGAAQLACEWSITEFNDVVTSGTNGSGAVVQSVTAGGGTGTQTTLSATLAAFADADDNVAFGVFGVNADNAITPGTGFTEIHEVRNATETETLQTQSRTGEDLSVDASWSSAVAASAIAIEIAKDDTTVLPTVPVATTTTITSDIPDPSTVGQAYTVSWTVVAADPDAGTLTGTVTVSDGTDSCNAAVAAGSCSLTSTTPGAKTLTATYSGDSTFATSNDTESHTVNAASVPGGPTLPVSGRADLRVRQVASHADRLVKEAGSGTADRTVDVVDSSEDLTVQVVDSGNVDFTIEVIGGNLD